MNDNDIESRLMQLEARLSKTEHKIESHEEKCDIRYQGIEKSLEKVITVLDKLREEMGLGRGAVRAVLWLGGALALLATVIKLSGAKI